MSSFTTDSDNNITALVGLPAGADQSQSFSTAKELAKLTAAWPVSRLADTWNSFAGVAPFDELWHDNFCFRAVVNKPPPRTRSGMRD
jgi:hypothetical protein